MNFFRFAVSFAVNTQKPHKKKHLKRLAMRLEASSSEREVPRAGIEPATPAFSVLCSTD
jgi:hypothetical protein